MMKFLARFLGPDARERRERNQFAKDLKKRLESAEGVGEVTYDAENFRLSLDTGQQINLGNFWLEHRRMDAGERVAHVANILQGIFQANFELPEDFEDVRPDLLPKIWARASFDRLDLKARVEGREPMDAALTPVGTHLYAGLVYDLPRSVRTIRQEELDQWDLSFYEAMEIALQNLRERPITIGRAGPEAPEEGDDAGMYIMTTGDSYDATRLLVAAEIDELKVAGRLVAMAPTRDTLLLTGDEDETGLTMMAGLGSQMIEAEPRPLAPLIMRHDDGEWQDWAPEADHPATPQLHAMELRYLAEEYAGQRPLLEEIESAKPDGERLHVGSLMVASNPEGEYRSFATWANGVPTLLPRADFVVLMPHVPDGSSGRTAEEPVKVTWADAEALCGELMESVPDLYPPRWRVTEFPHTKAIEILRESAID